MFPYLQPAIVSHQVTPCWPKKILQVTAFLINLLFLLLGQLVATWLEGKRVWGSKLLIRITCFIMFHLFGSKDRL